MGPMSALKNPIHLQMPEELRIVCNWRLEVLLSAQREVALCSATRSRTQLTKTYWNPTTGTRIVVKEAHNWCSWGKWAVPTWPQVVLGFIGICIVTVLVGQHCSARGHLTVMFPPQSGVLLHAPTTFRLGPLTVRGTAPYNPAFPLGLLRFRSTAPQHSR